jgi:alpha-tubulin suppressor-like RCC1 family protein
MCACDVPLEGTPVCNPPRISIGSAACAVDSFLDLRCWGANESGQVGNGQQVDQFTPVVIPGEWSTVSVGGDHAAALDPTGELALWGGLGGDKPDKVEGDADWTAITAGGAHGCGLREDGSAWCWGDNDLGALGDGTVTASATPVSAGAQTWVAISAGADHTCAIDEDRSLWCWGGNIAGQLGIGSADDQPHTTPVPAGPAGAEWASISAGGIPGWDPGSHTCGIRTNGTLWCWGLNGFGQLGDGTTTDSAIPMQVGTDADWQSVSTGGWFTFATKRDGSAWGFGAGDWGVFGDGLDASSLTPMPLALPNLRSWEELAVGLYNAALRHGNDDIDAWGHAGFGVLGAGPPWVPQITPPATAVGSGWEVVDGDSNTVCGVAKDGTLWCWGWNRNGQLGNGEIGPPRDHPLQVGTASDWASVTVGWYHACATRLDGTAWCWGTSDDGQLGNGTFITSATPVQVGTDSDWSTIHSGGRHTCGRRADGSLWCWGDNGSGQLGTTALPNSAVPVHVAAGTTWASATVGAAHSCGIQSDGSAWCWGDNFGGNLGDGTLNDSPVPLLVASSLPWVAIDASALSTCALRADGTLWCWGNHFTLTPQQLGNGTTWTSIGSGYLHRCATQADGSLWCGGDNSLGQLGDGTLDGTGPELAQVAAPAGWRAMTGGTAFTCGLRTDDSLSCWGERFSGSLGDDLCWAQTPVAVKLP